MEVARMAKLFVLRMHGPMEATVLVRPPPFPGPPQIVSWAVALLQHSGPWWSQYCEGLASFSVLPYKLCVDRDVGVVTYQWVLQARIHVSPSSPPTVSWDKNCVADVGVDFPKLVDGHRLFRVREARDPVVWVTRSLGSQEYMGRISEPSPITMALLWVVA
ncbi:unnamed protein product [Prorocentrum cordatum]|uniref:Autophagy protein 5 n=1 Tax=Prorocentrum cordatum TaxID=2364126 RepID=A0ABN9XNK3_9DINO|nr:unnamed protein product [Polarella glacialis]